MIILMTCNNLKFLEKFQKNSASHNGYEMKIIVNEDCINTSFEDFVKKAKLIKNDCEYINANVIKNYLKTVSNEAFKNKLLMTYGAILYYLNRKYDVLYIHDDVIIKNWHFDKLDKISLAWQKKIFNRPSGIEYDIILKEFFSGDVNRFHKCYDNEMIGGFIKINTQHALLYHVLFTKWHKLFDFMLDDVDTYYKYIHHWDERLLCLLSEHVHVVDFQMFEIVYDGEIPDDMNVHYIGTKPKELLLNKKYEDRTKKLVKGGVLYEV